jgi:hypothetical protein
MAAFVLFVVAVAGAVVAADLVWENPTVGQVTLFDHTVAGYPEGWLLAIAAGLGFVVALLLVASVNSTKGRRARRKQLRGLRRGLEDHMVAPEPDHARLLDAFFGLRSPSATLAGRPGRPTSGANGRRAERKTIKAGSQPSRSSTSPSRSTSRSDRPTSGRTAGRAERNMIRAGSQRNMIRAGSQANGSSIPPSRSTSRPGGPLGWAKTGSSRSRRARGAGGSGARRGSRRKEQPTTRWSHAA